ncbi:MAG: J domain-containing protein [Spirochaetota bacterium]|nr:J domain-containing protein [Spirochaetota bacterium]
MKIQLPPWIYPHLGKILGVLIGLLLGLRIFGIVFGFFCGALTDIFLQEIRLRKAVRCSSSIESVRRSYPLQLQGVIKISWFVIHAACAEFFDFFGQNRDSLSAAAYTSPDQHSLHYLQEVTIRQLSLSVRGKSAVRHVFGAFSNDPGIIPSLEALSGLPHPDLNASEQVVVSRLFYEAAAIGSDSALRSSRSSRIIVRLCQLLDIEEPYRQIAADIVHTQDNTNYELLGVNRDDSIQEIKKVYRTLAAHFHPDSLHGLDATQKEAATEAFIRIRSAYEHILLERGEIDG